MSDQSGSSRSRVLFEAALRDYEMQTGIALADHPLAEQIQNCDSVDSVTALFREQTQAFSEFREKDKVWRPLKNAVSVLYKLSAGGNFGRDIGLHLPPVTAIHTGLAVLLSAQDQAFTGVIGSYDALVDLLESIEHLLNRLDIYTKIEPTDALNEMIVKILVELLSTLALATEQITQGKPKKHFKKLLGEREVEAVLQRLDRLTDDEARITAAQTLEIVYGLTQNMKVVMDDRNASVDHLRDILEIMQQIASDSNKSEREILRKDLSKWLSPPDPWKNHHIACESRHRGSASWFVEGKMFADWKTSKAPSSLLWVHGKPGAGKSVFCSTIIKDVDAMRKAGLASFGFFYCDFRDDQKKNLRGLLSSLLVQLCHQSGSYYDLLFKFYSDHAEGSRDPSDDELVECLKALLKLPGLAPVYLIMDGLDECPNTSAIPSPRDKVLNFLGELITSQFPNLRICVTSRPETDIKAVLDPLISCSVCLHDQSEQKRDIEDYIKSVINTHPKNRMWKAEHKQQVIEVLTKKADGMFRWVYCQVVYICGCIPARIQHALADLPETLDETYQRTLKEINKADWECAHRLFQFVAMASRPLRAEELAELLAFDFKAVPIPKFHEGWRLEDPVGAVLSTCSSLLAVVDGGHSFEKLIQFSHFSVKEYLTSTRLAESSDIISRRYHVSMTPAHTLVAQACLGILLHLDKDVVTRDGPERWPLAGYAAEHWVDHAQVGDVSRIVEDGMKRLFNPNKPHLAVCVWIHNPNAPPWERNRRAEKPLPPLRTSLHYAALWGLHSMVEFLIIEHSQDVHFRGFSDNVTPLHMASKYGHVKAARMLIKRGANLSAQDKYGKTPLHLAMQQEQVKIARILIERGANLTIQDVDGKTPLHLALQHEQVEFARILIERGADVEAQDTDGKTPFYLALEQGQVEIARILIERGADVTARDKHGKTPLHLALQQKQVEIARMLIERGADLTAQNMYGETPLHLALQREQVEIARILIERGAGVTARDKQGSTPLHLALQREQVEIARILIERGADLTAQDMYEETPLHLALQQRQAEIARVLIERGADLTVKDKHGKAPLHLALQREQVEISRMLIERGADLTSQDKHGNTPLHLALQQEQVEIARMLIERGADVTTQDKHRKTPFHLALQREQVDIARMLIERGADVTTQNIYGETQLHLALQQEQVEIARMLIERGADLMAQDEDGKTPLHLALQRGQVEIARILIERGADLTAQDEDGKTPLHLASQKGQVEVARLLIERGAGVTAQDRDGDTPLHQASTPYWSRPSREYEEVARILLDHGANVNAQNKHGLTPSSPLR